MKLLLPLAKMGWPDWFRKRGELLVINIFQKQYPKHFGREFTFPSLQKYLYIIILKQTQGVKISSYYGRLFHVKNPLPDTFVRPKLIKTCMLKKNTIDRFFLALLKFSKFKEQQI